MSVFRDVTITFRGQAYTVTPSNRMIRRLEQDVSISRMMVGWSKGEPLLGATCYVLAEMLRSAGARVTEDDVLQEVTHGGQDGIALLGVVMDALTPVAPEGPASGE
jgi:hypothetical protein